MSTNNNNIPETTPSTNMHKVELKMKELPPQAAPVILYRSRWLILVIFSMVNLAYGAQWITFSSISDIIVRYYGIEALLVDWLSMSFLLGYIFFALPSAIFLSRYGLRATILVAAVLNTCGTFVRLAGADTDSFVYIALGQFFVAVAGPFILAVPPELAAVWFGDHERAIATSIGMLMNYVGVAIGFLQPTLMVPDILDVHLVKLGLVDLLQFQAVFCAISLILVVLFFKEKPDTPPSVSQALRNNKLNQHSFFSSLKILARNWNFHLTAQAYGIMFGLLTVVSTLLNQIIKYSFRYVADFQIGLMGFVATLVGIVGILLFGIWIETYKLYKATSVVVYAVNTLCLIAMATFVLWTPNFTLVFVVFCLLNLVAVPFTSFGLEQIAEITYPLSEFTTCTAAMVTGNVYGFILTYIHGWMLEVDLLREVFFCLIALSTIGLVLIMFAKVPMKRSETDHTKLKLVPVNGNNESGYESTLDGVSI